ncbi:antitoxin [Gammaproteobacteria bacterium]|nr:antitoxin [Gammaproteobacteria bacterium]
MVKTKVFLTNKTQAVRLPKAVSLPDSVDEVEISILGNSRVISPAGQSWDAWFERSGVSEDFMHDRDQPTQQNRESFQ